MECTTGERDAPRDQIAGQGAAYGSFATRIAAYIIWSGLITFCVGLTISHGLSFADDGFFASIAKCLSTGLGYATPFGNNNDPAQPLLFNPSSGTGPTLVVPCAAFLKVFGINEILPGICAIVFWAGLLTFFLIEVDRLTERPVFLAGTATLCITILAVFAYHFEQWFAFLGEVPAMSLLAVAHWIAAMRRFSARTLFFCGLLAGLAIETKHLAVLAMPGVLLIYGIRLWSLSPSPGFRLRSLWLLPIGCVLPILIFEGFKLQQLGPAGFIKNWVDFLAMLHQMAVTQDPLTLWQRCSRRLALLDDRFSLSPVAFLVFITLVLGPARSRLGKHWLTLLAGLSVSIVIYSLYWLTASIGWPRYAVIPVGLGCLALCIPVWASTQWTDRAVFIMTVLLLVGGGLPRVLDVWKGADAGLFRPSVQRLARAKVVSKLRKLQKTGPVLFASSGPESFTDVEFSLPGHCHFRTLQTLPAFHGKKFVLLNRNFMDANDPAVKQARQDATRVVLMAGSYELLETK